MSQIVATKVPATTSNLGPGFDCLGLSLALYNIVTAYRSEAAADDPFLQATAQAFFKKTGVPPFSFQCKVAGEVPRARGLGSSASVRVGLLDGLNRLCNHPLSTDELFKVCTELEGHPDNAAPAIYGGFTVAKGQELPLRFEVDSSLKFILLIPDFEIKTEFARNVLPESMSWRGAVESCTNACRITAAFAARDYPSLRGAFTDALHQPFRQKFIPHFNKVVQAALGAGALGAFLSGSGPTMIALALDRPDTVGEAMRLAFSTGDAQVIITQVGNSGHQSLA